MVTSSEEMSVKAHQVRGSTLAWNGGGLVGRPRRETSHTEKGRGAGGTSYCHSRWDTEQY